MVNLAKNDEWVFPRVCSPENFLLAIHASKLIEKYVGKAVSGRAQHQRMSWSELADGMQWLQDHFVFFNPPEDELQYCCCSEVGKKGNTRYGIRGLIIDPWNEFEHSMERGQSETNYIGETLTKIRQFGRNHGVHMWVVAHPMKLKKREDDTYPVPTPYDINGSANWRNKADNCVTVHRDAAADDTREAQACTKGTVSEDWKGWDGALSWNPVNGRYSWKPPKTFQCPFCGEVFAEATMQVSTFLKCGKEGVQRTDNGERREETSR